MTLVEIMVSLSLLALIVLSLMTVLVDSRKQVASTAKVRNARHAANSMVSVLRAQSLRGIGGVNDFRTLLADWDQNNIAAPYNAPWAGAAGPGSKGVFFNVPGLPRRVDGLPHGKIQLFLTAPGANIPAFPWPAGVDPYLIGGGPTSVLKESNVANLAFLGDGTTQGTLMPLDMNADGNTSSELLKNPVQPVERYRVLPVQITVQWGNATAPQISIFTILTQKNEFKRNTG